MEPSSQTLPAAAHGIGPERVTELAAVARGRRNAVCLTHDNPDPDSMASAAGVAWLLDELCGVPCKVAYGGIIGRAENRAMTRALRLQLVPVSKIVFEEQDLIALVDTQPDATNHSLPAHYFPDIVVDHHPPRPSSRLVPFAEVGGDFGATSTVLVKLIRAAGLIPPTQVATALFYGIKSDTRDLGREYSAADTQAYSWLFPYVDLHVLSQIEHPQVPARLFESYHQAFEQARVHRFAVVTDLGPVFNPDVVAEIADRMLSLEGMKWSLALGEYEGMLYISLRTNDRRMNAGRLIREIAETIGGSAGGHGAMAGARLSLGGMDRAERTAFGKMLTRKFLDEFGLQGVRGRRLIRGRGP